MTCDKCKIVKHSLGDYIVLCHLHAAAGEMREMLERITREVGGHFGPSSDYISCATGNQIAALLAATEPKP